MYICCYNSCDLNYLLITSIFLQILYLCQLLKYLLLIWKIPRQLLQWKCCLIYTTIQIDHYKLLSLSRLLIGKSALPLLNYKVKVVNRCEKQYGLKIVDQNSLDLGASSFPSLSGRTSIIYLWQGWVWNHSRTSIMSYLNAITF